MGAIEAAFEVKGWDESPFDEGDGVRKLTRASVTKELSGDIEGSAALEYLMAYKEDGTATFVGIERITGRIGGRSGSLVVQHVGTFADGAARAALTVVPGSGTGELAGASGEGDFLADPAGTLSLDLTFDP